MADFLTALALAISIEGALYAVFPEGMKKMMAQVQVLPNQHLRTAGMAAALVGVGLVWLIRG